MDSRACSGFFVLQITHTHIEYIESMLVAGGFHRVEIPEHLRKGLKRYN